MANRRALIVANDSYDNEGLCQLGAPAHDAEALQAVLANPQIGRFDVKVLYNNPSHVIRLEVEKFFADSKSDDLLLLHFSCHGLKDASGELYLATTDTQPTLLKATAVPAQFVNQVMVDSRARRIVLLLDCCYGGAFSRGAVARAAGGINVEDSFPLTHIDSPQADNGRGKVVISASSAIEYAFEDDRLAKVEMPTPSVFTSALVRGLRTGEADIGQDGMVDLDELYDYVYQQVRATTAHQTPSKPYMTDVEGKFVVAWAPLAVRIVAAEIPEELVARARHPLSDERYAAARDLRRILLDEDEERAAGALDLLRRLSGDDSNKVATAAIAMVEEAQLKAEPSRLDLGVVVPGEPLGGHTIRLVGSPLAQVCQAMTTTRWLRIEQPELSHDSFDTRLRVTVDLAALPEGRRDIEGSINVVNRLGEFEIPVVGQIAGRLLRPRTVVNLPKAPWVHDWKVLTLTGGVAAAATLATASSGGENSLLHASSFLGVGYYLIRFALLFAAIFLINRAGPHQTIGWGVATATTAYFLTDTVVTIHGSATAAAWLQFLAVITFASLLAIRVWPFTAVPRRLPVVPPTQRPLAYITLAAAAALFFFLFVAIPSVPYGRTIIDVTGALGALLEVIPIAGLCCAVALAESLEETQRIFIGAMILAYVGPELYFMLGSLLLGAQFTYLGNFVGGPGLSAGWFVLMRAAVLATLITSTFLIMRRAEPGSSGPAPHRN